MIDDDANLRVDLDIITVHPVHIRNLLYALKDMFAEVRFMVDKDGIHLTKIDANCVMGVHVVLRRDMFDRFVVPARPVWWGLKPATVHRLVAGAAAKDHMQFRQFAGNPDVLQILQYADGDKYPLTHLVKLIDPVALEFDPPMDPPAMSLRVPSEVVNKMLKSSNRQYGGAVRLVGRLDPPHLRVVLLHEGCESSRRIDATEVGGTRPAPTDAQSLVGMLQARVAHELNGKYVEKIFRAHRLDPHVVVHLPPPPAADGQARVIRVVYELCDGKGFLAYFLGTRTNQGQAGPGDDSQ
jgi:hypothetical protein